VDGWGVEGSANLILGENWDLYVSAAWADTEARKVQAACGFTDDCEGNSLPELPEFSYAAVLQGVFPALAGGEWIGRVEMFGQSKTGGGLENDPAGKMGAYTEWTLRAGYRAAAGWQVLGYVENVTHKKYFDAAHPIGGILPAHYFGPARPRTYGVSLRWTLE
jgi:iron complex outermembrane recepter protein